MRYKYKFDIKKAVKHWFTTRIWLKLIALILAIMFWLYIGEELRRFLL
ncbi:MAG: hypothetical protein KKH80_03820 [Candidatus Omnitrophica bacterium]|nr:hypothetical protein [Candidatus Omnitrophota bacterium]MBU1871907.1 hypothetical protein [Candidatus Omnitrophota bacterium]